MSNTLAADLNRAGATGAAGYAPPHTVPMVAPAPAPAPQAAGSAPMYPQPHPVGAAPQIPGPPPAGPDPSNAITAALYPDPDPDPDQPAADSSAMELARAEVAAEPVAYRADSVVVPLGTGGPLVHIRPTDEWTTAAQNCLRDGDFDGWAVRCLDGADYDDVWAVQNDGDGPSLGPVNWMFEEFGRLTGQTTGKSRRSTSTLRPTGRR